MSVAVSTPEKIFRQGRADEGALTRSIWPANRVTDGPGKKLRPPRWWMEVSVSRNCAHTALAPLAFDSRFGPNGLSKKFFSLTRPRASGRAGYRHRWWSR